MFAGLSTTGQVRFEADVRSNAGAGQDRYEDVQKNNARVASDAKSWITTGTATALGATGNAAAEVGADTIRGSIESAVGAISGNPSEAGNAGGNTAAGAAAGVGVGGGAAVGVSF